MGCAQLPRPSRERSIGLGLAGRDLYVQLAPALQEATGIDIGLWRGGIANVALHEGMTRVAL